MIKRKKKTCKGCKKEKYIFGYGLCKSCYNFKKSVEYSRNKPGRKPIKKISHKHRQTLKEYQPKRNKFLKNNPICQAHLNGCTLKATEVHHKKGKASKQLYLDASKWMSVCRNCHSIIENMGAKSYELGFKLYRNT